MLTPVKLTSMWSDSKLETKRIASSQIVLGSLMFDIHSNQKSSWFKSSKDGTTKI